jgi:hypothetical protein
MVDPMSKDPSYPGVDPRVVQLFVEGMIGTTWPCIHPHGHLLPIEWLDRVADKGS